jgi:rhodanese-related sulfurtransferase
MIKQITALELKNKISVERNQLLLLDVREQFEYEFAKIQNSILIPLGQLEHRIEELDSEQEVVVICHHGIRSQQAANYLFYRGFKKVSNLVGGIDAWSCACEGDVPRY